MPWFNAKNVLAEDPVMGLLREQVTTTRKGVSIALDAVEGHLSVDESRKSVNDIEHEGDEVRSKVVHALAKAWTTPLDREDLFRFSRSSTTCSTTPAISYARSIFGKDMPANTPMSR